MGIPDGLGTFESAAPRSVSGLEWPAWCRISAAAVGDEVSGCPEEAQAGRSTLEKKGDSRSSEKRK